MSEGKAPPEWQRAWDARKAAFEKLFGKADPKIITSFVPIYLDGKSDVLTFHPLPGGVVYITAGLTHTSSQPPSLLGNYELMICTRGDEDWPGGLLSGLSNMTLQSPINPGDTIDLGEHQPSDVTTRAVLAIEPERPRDRFEMLGETFAIVLLVTITASEFLTYRSDRTETVMRSLRESVLPYSDLKRPSVI